MHLPGITRTRAPGQRRPAQHRTARRGLAAFSSLLLGAGLLPAALFATPAGAVQAPVGQGFSITPSDLSFILDQIKIAERHAYTQTPDNECGTLVGNGPDQIPSPLISKGLRTVDGSCNNLIPGQERNGSADQLFPRLGGKSFRDAEEITPDFPVGPPGATSYKQKKGSVVDSEPRVISNLIVDQTSTNPAAIAAAGFPVRAQGGDSPGPCTAPDVPVGCVPIPEHETLFIPNVTTDVGLSPPYNSLFTLFGQFFDHGVDQTVKSGGTVFVPLKADDPLIPGPDHILGNDDDLDPSLRFMVLTRAKNQPGPDGILGDPNPAAPDTSADDIQDATNTDSPWVDQSQTYTSHPSHQVFLREYDVDAAGHPVATGRLLGGPTGPQAGGIGTWAEVKKQAAEKLGLLLTDKDVLDIPMLAADPYGNFIPGKDRGLPQYVTASGLVEGNTAAPVAVPANTRHFDTPFVGDIAHNADPSPQDIDHNPTTPPEDPAPDDDDVASADFANQPPGTYDDEMLNAHFACGDGRCNENIGLSAIHQIFHSEHDRLVGNITNTLNDPANAALRARYEDVRAINPDDVHAPHTFTFGERLFQAARFVTEMEYQHLVFEEFARKVQPAINPFEPFAFTQTELNPAIKAEFAHAVYRFGHSMLTETIARHNEDGVGPDGEFGTSDDVRGSDNDISLLDGFLNPPAYTQATPGGPTGQLTSEEAAGSIIMGMSDQTGNELDEFVTDTLRNNLLGLPLDLPTINMTRARSEGIPPLNVLRRQLHNATNDSQLMPYTSWVDFGEHLKHPESLVNFVAAYGTHDTITGATTLVAKRDAARAIVAPQTGDIPPADAAAFMNSSAATSGLDNVDLWVGGLAEVTNVFGGLLGSTFNFVFENQLTDLQNGDRLYYLARTPGMNLRTQLEGNSFAELMMRNTNVKNLKADAFSTADCKFELKKLFGTPDGFATHGGNTIADDPDSECNESLVLIRMPDGTIKYRNRNSVDPSGINGQSVYNGTAGVDRIAGGNDSDTFWGGLGNDIIEGGDGADVALGGEGDDIITDLNGDDVPKGGPGNDAIEAGPGLDIIMGGEGNDFTNGGANANETFGGDGDDFIMLGQSLDAAFGDSGDDFEEGGDQPDLMQGDSGNLFFQDDAQKNGHDILVGQGGDDDYDMEGGDDIGVGGPGIEKVAGASGYDWEIGLGDPQAQNQDLDLPLVGLDVLTTDVRDKFNEVEALSGWNHNDVLRGDSVVPADVTGGGFIGNDFLTQDGVDRIAGLRDLLSIPSRATAPNATWGEGNILLGGAGSDVLEGRGADDVIDGDKYLSVRLSVRDPGNRNVEIGTTGLELTGQSAMTSPYLPGDPTTLQEAVFAGRVNPGDIVAVREIRTGSGGTDAAVFSGNEAEYTVTTDGDKTTVTHDNAGIDGVDTVFNVERLVFADGTRVLSGANLPATGTVTVTGSPVVGGLLTASGAGITDPDGPSSITLQASQVTWEIATGGGGGGGGGVTWEQVGSGLTFKPTAAEVGSQLRAVARFTDAAGVPEVVRSEATEPVVVGPVDPGPVDPGPVDPGPVDPGPVDPGPGNPAPGNPAPGNPAPGNPAPGNPAPGNPAPAGPAPVVPNNVPATSVAPSLVSSLSATSLGVNAAATLSGAVEPFRGVTVTLERQIGTAGWTAVQARTISDSATSGGFRFRVPTAASGKVAFRVKVSGPGVATTTSAAKTLAIYRAKVSRVSPAGREFVTVRNTGKVTVNLAGWKLRDRSGTTLSLSRYSLKPGAVVRVYTGSGTKATGRLYVGRSADVWGSHDTVRLVDRVGATIARLRY